ncbi:MAG: hypothetical protein A2015_14545 [Spirochaetes bacterium GWF1_31_7]|nr:MAG: hypothetical protein A2Y30_03210 [Spirochaetes bacterium GWE1_32_154]OHD48208.1 MAG: hypothetical protein A2Y29_07435 [Spirochaetes bacterium GWE2_31_10]OHD50616.1 MAG: hypothetical protein A2015_14545 [Spirochaetes bacterium GWF1_31_7]OHD73843.1 MAG: hypothetical protein A2355_11795 [Spirochaetes bacterium RIFOXYB1_FULL_32_8]HBD92718.1 hypothetical protein [Spirochaetia bacterium]
MISPYFFTDETKQNVSDLINTYEGGEIFFGCVLEEDGSIISAIPICYGNEEAVLAPFEIAEKYNAVLHNHPSGNTQPSGADLQYASVLKNQGIGFFITNNSAEKLTTVIPPVITRKSSKIRNEELNDIFHNEGSISKFKKDYEFRDGQLKMSMKVADSFNHKSIAVIEAGTGIGKSLAYLFPAFLYAEKNNERVVISTNTINLQSQLLNKDIPFVKKILNSEIEAVLVKGRRNYLCKLKIYHADTELEFSDDQEEFNNILEWSNTTNTGTVDELNFVPNPAVWEKASSDADFCMGSNCIFYRECFLQLARRRASEANVLIVNHHILFADLQIRAQSGNMDENILLPPYKKIIFDEAHNIEKAASSYFTATFSKAGFYKFIALYRGKKNKSFIKTIMTKMLSAGGADLYAIGEYIEREVLGTLDSLYNNASDVFHRIDGYLERIIKTEGYGGPKVTINHRILKEEWESPDFQTSVIEPLKNLSELIENFSSTLDNTGNLYEGLPDGLKSKYEIDFKTLKGYSSKLNSYYKEITEVLNTEIGRKVAWLEIFGDKDSPLFNLVSSPLYINIFLYESLHSVFESIVFASATLTINKSFDFFMSTIGLNLVKEKEIEVSTFDSPFHYDEKVLFVVPTDIPEPNSSDYNEKLNTFIEQSIKVTKGSSFVLFTSYSQLQKSFDVVNPQLREAGYRSFKQGDKSKDALLQLFIEEQDSNLFATDSFWEGVDAPGDTLRYVILTKLPFRMPTEPLEQARVEDLKKRGLDPFIFYTVPTAVIKFRQGFGRLIRTKSDYGIVALLDSRALSKSYGKTFFQSLPRCKFKSGKTLDILHEIGKHIDLMKKNR